MNSFSFLDLTLSNFPYYKCATASLVSVWLFETYLNIRQRRKLQAKQPHKILLDNKLTTMDDYQKSQEYGLDKINFSIIKDLFQLVESLFFISYGYVYLWNVSLNMLNYNKPSSHMIIESLLFVTLYQIFKTIINIPFGLYSSLVIDEKPFGLFDCFSIIKDLLIGTIIGCLLIPIISFIPIFYLLMFTSIFLLISMWLTPFFIMNSFESLEDKHLNHKANELKDELTNLSNSLSFPLKKIFVMDGSKISSHIHSNAFQYGFCGNKCVVLFDTLLNEMNCSEIVSIVCHELGHWKYNHSLKGFFVTEIQFFLTFFLFSIIYTNNAFYESFGFFQDDNNLIIIGCLLFSYLLTPTNILLHFIQNYLARRWEYQADDFAAHTEYGYDLHNALVVLFKLNKTTLDSDALYEAYHNNHPSALYRLEALQKIKKKIV